ncbi:MAG: hypothetical protein AAGB11_10860 [Pseudomonadota bacterium]
MLYEGFAILGNDTILAGFVLVVIGVFIIENKLKVAALIAGVGAVFTLVGFMHAVGAGIAVSPALASAYLVLSLFLLALGRLEAYCMEAAPASSAVAE